MTIILLIEICPSNAITIDFGRDISIPNYFVVFFCKSLNLSNFLH
jgi:hypothetical protein